MADLKISALTASTTPLAGTEVLPIVQSSTTKQVSVANLTAGRAVSALSYASTTGATFATTSGNVGIGATAPAAALSFSKGDGETNGIVIGHPNWANTYYAGIYGSVTNGASNTQGILRFGTRANATDATLTNGLAFFPNGDFQLDFGNLVIGTSGKGIDFSATPGTGTSELLADYEEGTWTPTFSSTGLTVGYGTRNGQYVKVGSLVNASMYVQVTSTSGTLTNALTISGLPFASNATNYGSSGVFGTEQFLAYRPNASMDASQTQITIYRAGTVTALTGAELANGFYLLSITYRV